MGLQQVRVLNFKSYAGETVIPIDHNPFVAVIGPNGSGKSNLLDAICFVMGMSAKSLRCTSYADLVHTGAADMFVEATVEGRDYVSHTFRRSETGYVVDGELISEKEYIQHWEEMNVFPDMRNSVVMQGDIESLAAAPADALARLIEGVSAPPMQADDDRIDDPTPPLQKLRQEYELLQSQLKRAAREARSQNSSRRAAQEGVDRAKQIQDAKGKFEKLRKELKRLERRRHTLADRERRAVLGALRKRLAAAKETTAAALEEVDLIGSDSRDLRSEYARNRRRLQSARAAEQEAAEALAAGNAELTVLNRKVSAVEAEKRLIEPELTFANSQFTSATAEVEGAERALRLLDRAREKEDTPNVQISSEVREQWMTLDGQFTTETALQQDAVDDAKRKYEHARQRAEAAERETEDLETGRSVTATRLQHAELLLQQMRGLVEERSSAATAKRDELEAVAEELQENKLEQRQLASALRELSDRIRTTDGNKRALAQRHRLLDAVERLKRAHPGVINLLGNLVEATEPRFAAAIERGLGANADAVVVDTEATALACVVEARKERLGSLTFLPIADLKVGELAGARAQLASNAATRGGDTGDARLLLDCVEFAPRVRPAIVYAIGDSVFAHDMTSALSLRRAGITLRIITEDASVLATNNTLSASPGSNASSAASDRSLAATQRKAASTAERLKAAASRELELLDRETVLTSQIGKSTQAADSAERELLVAQEQVTSAKRNADNAADSHSRSLSVLDDARTAADDAYDIYTKLRRDLAGSREKKFASFLSRAGGTLDEWDALFAGHRHRNADFTRQKQRLEDRLRVAVQRLDVASDQLKKLEQRNQVLIDALAKITAEINTVEHRYASARTKSARAQERLAAARVEAETRNDAIGATEASFEAAKTRLAEAEREEHRCEVELVAEFGEDVIEADSDDLAVAEEGSDSVALDRIDTRLREIREQLRPIEALMGAANGDNADVEESSQRYIELVQSTGSQRAAHDALREKFEALRSVRSDTFNASLEKVQQALSSVYSELVGFEGQAHLTPTNPDEPFSGIEFAIMPPSKAYTPVSQLSGGERSMAALALIFALQSLRPAPFVVLDEVDAALDFANIAAVAKYLQNHEHTTQFVVVSLKQRLFQRASHLVGVYQPPKIRESRVLTTVLKGE